MAECFQEKPNWCRNEQVCQSLKSALGNFTDWILCHIKNSPLPKSGLTNCDRSVNRLFTPLSSSPSVNHPVYFLTLSPSLSPSFSHDLPPSCDVINTDDGASYFVLCSFFIFKTIAILL